ncbi:MAG TPA: hypothetical protein VGE12_02145 [Noviherbaspirillum sp.]
MFLGEEVLDLSPPFDSWYGQDTTAGMPSLVKFGAVVAGFMNTLAAAETFIKPFRAGAYVLLECTILKPAKSNDQ